MIAPIGIIGGGFYGAYLADWLSRSGVTVVLFEMEDGLLRRASYSNQARLHAGYHYPRSIATAFRSGLNFGTFSREFRDAIDDEFIKIYAIANRSSKVTATQYMRFCRLIGAPLQRLRAPYRKLLNFRLIEDAWETREYAFHAGTLADILQQRLTQSGVDVRLGCRVVSVDNRRGQGIYIELADGSGTVLSRLFNCTYAGINGIRGMFRTAHGIKHEIAEMALVEMPPELEGVSITVMDGPFFSFMPFPDQGLNTFSHVRYTPHCHWYESDEFHPDPYDILRDYEKRTAWPLMQRDAMRYVPAVAGMRRKGSLFEIKTTLKKSDNDDGRPILFEHDPNDPRVVSMMGSKIDNIYDGIEATERHLHVH